MSTWLIIFPKELTSFFAVLKTFSQLSPFYLTWWCLSIHNASKFQPEYLCARQTWNKDPEILSNGTQQHHPFFEHLSYFLLTELLIHLEGHRENLGEYSVQKGAQNVSLWPIQEMCSVTKPQWFPPTRWRHVLPYLKKTFLYPIFKTVLWKPVETKITTN